MSRHFDRVRWVLIWSMFLTAAAFCYFGGGWAYGLAYLLSIVTLVWWLVNHPSDLIFLYDMRKMASLGNRYGSENFWRNALFIRTTALFLLFIGFFCIYLADVAAQGGDIGTYAQWVNQVFGRLGVVVLRLTAGTYLIYIGMELFLGYAAKNQSEKHA